MQQPAWRLLRRWTMRMRGDVHGRSLSVRTIVYATAPARLNAMQTVSGYSDFNWSEVFSLDSAEKASMFLHLFERSLLCI